MKLVTKQEDITALLQKVKNEGKGFITNFYIDQEKLTYWINEQLICFIDTEDGVLFFRKNHSFYHLYFSAASLENLQLLINNHLPQQQLVVDIIGDAENGKKLVDLFIGRGFKVYTQLHRYVRINTGEKQYFQAFGEVALAAKEDAGTIAQMFGENFDEFSEQVPVFDEVKKLIEEKKVLVIKEHDVIKGFLVRTFTGQTTVLNNFLVDKRFRGEKIGSKLLKHYIFEAKNTKRMMLWVVADNETALTIYRQHGYVQDNLVDFILINK